jgi:hypothetical protein
MPYILFYADAKDFRKLLRFLSEHPDIAFIVSAGPHRWRAQRIAPRLKNDSVALWHVPSGALPLLHPPPSEKVGRIRNPWEGWKELFPGADTSCPYFGPGHPGVVWLTRQARSPSVRGAVGMSSFEWIGDRYARAGNPVPKATRAFWKFLEKWVAKHSVLIPRKGSVSGSRREIWAFPSALASFKQGKKREEDWF